MLSKLTYSRLAALKQNEKIAKKRNKNDDF